MKQIEALTFGCLDKISENIKRHMPFIVKTGIDFENNFNRFVSKFHHEPILILKHSKENSGTRKNAITKTVKFSEYLNDDYIKSGWFFVDNMYNNKIFRSYISDTVNLDHDLTRLIDSEKPMMVNLWLSPPAKFVGLHCDPLLNNFNLQVLGSKTFICAPPQVKGFYPGKMLNAKYHTSNVIDLFDYDVLKFPDFAKNRPAFYKAEMSAGDLLYLPAFWWHQVYTGDFPLAVNINWWYRCDLAELLKNPRQGAGAVCTYVYRKVFQRHLL